MNEDEYIEKRLDDQIDWYSKKSTGYQKSYKLWQIVKIVAALSIPVLTMWLEEHPDLKYVIGVLGVVVAFVEGLSKIYNHKELWMTYRMTSEQLKREKMLFLTRSEPYNVENPFPLLVKRSEKLMIEENSIWTETIKSSRNT